MRRRRKNGSDESENGRTRSLRLISLRFQVQPIRSDRARWDRIGTNGELPEI